MPDNEHNPGSKQHISGRAEMMLQGSYVCNDQLMINRATTENKLRKMKWLSVVWKEQPKGF